ncbi:MAG: hypothetical protein WA918_01945 [Erythrobacter sp.]
MAVPPDENTASVGSDRRLSQSGTAPSLPDLASDAQRPAMRDRVELAPLLSSVAGPDAQAGSAPVAAAPPSAPPPAGQNDPTAVLRSAERVAPMVEAMVEQALKGRDAQRGDAPGLVLRHGEFGTVSMRVETAGRDWRAVLTSPDPTFVPAMQTALAERGQAERGSANVIEAALNAAQRATEPGQTTNQWSQSGQSSQPGQSTSSHGEPRYGSSPGSGQASSQPETEQSGEEDTRTRPLGDPSDERQQQAHVTDRRRGGLFA